MVISFMLRCLQLLKQQQTLITELPLQALKVEMLIMVVSSEQVPMMLLNDKNKKLPLEPVTTSRFVAHITMFLI